MVEIVIGAICMFCNAGFYHIEKISLDTFLIVTMLCLLFMERGKK